MPSGRPVWEDLLTANEAAALDPGVPDDLNRQPDVLIVGGGMVGLATAVMCRRAGLGSVTVLEQGTLGAGASGGAAGLLIPDAHHGTDPAPFVALGRSSLAAWRELDSSWPEGAGLVRLDWLGLEPLPADFAANLPPTAQLLDEDEVQQLVPALAVPRRGVLLGDQGRVNPLRALARLATRLVTGGGGVATGVNVLDVVIRRDRAAAVASSIGELTPRVVVFATGGPPALPHLRLDISGQVVKGHLLVTEPVTMRLPGTVAPFATQLEDGRLLSGGTLDADDTTPDVRRDVVAEMRSLLNAALPMIREVRTSHAWCCFRPAVPDRLPVIDRVPGLANVWVTCGHFRTGILMAPATGQLIADWVATNERPVDAYPFRMERDGVR